MDRAERKQLSDDFRDAINNLGPQCRANIERIMLQTFEVQSIRNVQLWTRYGAQTRNFISDRSSELEFRMRVAFARAIADPTPFRGPSKSAVIDGSPQFAGTRLRRYLQDPYIVGDEDIAGALREAYMDEDCKLVLRYESESSGLGGGVEVGPDDSEFDDIFYFDQGA